MESGHPRPERLALRYVSAIKAVRSPSTLIDQRVVMFGLDCREH
jgi:hypothetical protein